MQISTTYYKKLTSWRIIGVAIALIVMGLFLTRTAFAASAEPTPKNGQFVVTIYDQGQKRVVLTKANTVRQTLERANIQLADHDKVEPSLDTEYAAQRYTVNIYRARPVMIVDGMKRAQVLSAESAPRDIAKKAGLTLQKEDEVALAQTDDMLTDGMGTKLTITRSTPVNLVLYGAPQQVYTQAATVGELLDEKDVKLASEDTLSVAKTAPLTRGMTVEIWRNGVQTVNEEQEVDYETEQIQDADKPVGFREVRTPGVKGKKTVTYEVTMKNGQEVERKEIQSVVTTQPEKEVVVVGAKSTNTFDGDFAAALARLRSCEGSYTSNTGNGYYGAYQYDIGTWGGYQGFANASLAPPSVQDQKAWETYQSRGWQPWPSCSRSQGLQDIYR